MVTSRRKQEQEVVVKKFTLEDINFSIEKLKRRIRDIEALQGIRYNDPKIENADDNIRETIREVFGQNSPEFYQFQYYRIEYGPIHIGMSERQSQQNFEDGLTRTITKLEGLISRLEEKKSDINTDSVSRSRNAFEQLNLHPRISSVTTTLYKNGHYADAVFNASKALIHYVQEKSQHLNLDGVSLMTTVFSKNHPILAFNDLSDKTDLDEQEGMMHLFMGAILGIRNPRGHSFVDDSPERALEYIAFISMLAARIDESQITSIA